MVNLKNSRGISYSLVIIIANRTFHSFTIVWLNLIASYSNSYFSFGHILNKKNENSWFEKKMRLRVSTKTKSTSVILCPLVFVLLVSICTNYSEPPAYSTKVRFILTITLFIFFTNELNKHADYNTPGLQLYQLYPNYFPIAFELQFWCSRNAAHIHP